MDFDVYKDIALRTKGDIYLGVVGPVRTGKSTFITKFLNTLVLPNIADTYDLERTIDEMPVSGDGKTIMTTQPKFLPNEAVQVNLDNNVSFNVRLVDCVGYLVNSAIGHIENDKPRMVNTPWSEDQMPFEKAAEIGTNKVITQHSTIGIMVTTDGSITDIPREDYVDAEERVVSQLKQSGKPYVIILNSTHPFSPETVNLAKSLKDKYGVAVMPLNVSELDGDNINALFANILNEFPINKICVKLPNWMNALPYDSEFIQEIVQEVMTKTADLVKIGEVTSDLQMFENSENIEQITGVNVSLGEGKIVIELQAKPEVFYKVLSSECGFEIKDDYQLVSYIKELSVAKVQYDKFKDALEQVKTTGYGVVQPSLDEMTLATPQIIKQGSKYGVKLKASAPSLHLMQIDLETEVNSLVGSEQQSEDLVKYMLSEFESNPEGLWETKMFGTSLHHLVNEGLHNKLVAVPQEAMKKMCKTMKRIVNEGKGGVICILL
ncbi:MAG: stage IV sporulation protein A [Clostridia bacterium]|nr:stage IV sporulation protein A [Clostridia bacterium]